MKTKKMSEGERIENEEEVEKMLAITEQSTYEDDCDRFLAEVRRVNPHIPIPAQNKEQLDALDQIAIFAPLYAKYAEQEEQVPHGSCSVRYCPSNTMAKHAELYGMVWQVEHHDDPEKRFWHVQKK